LVVRCQKIVTLDMSVCGYVPKPKRRLFNTLKSQGLQANQYVTFLIDGVRRSAH
jgi:hypothetical protein